MCLRIPAERALIFDNACKSAGFTCESSFPAISSGECGCRNNASLTFGSTDHRECLLIASKVPEASFSLVKTFNT